MNKNKYFIIDIREFNENIKNKILKKKKEISTTKKVIVRIIITERTSKSLENIVKFLKNCDINLIIFKFEELYKDGRLVKLRYYQANAIPFIWKILRKNKRVSFFFENIPLNFFKSRIETYPITAHIEPTNRCMLKCIFCDVGQGLIKKKEDMSFENFKKIIDQIPTLKHIRLWNLGEPLMNKDIFRMINYAKIKGIEEVVLSTNGIFLTKDVSKKIIKAGLDYIIISLDAATKETYFKHRINKNFENLLKNIQELIRIKNEKRTKKPIVNLQFIITRNNEHEIEKMKLLAKRLEVDRISFKTLSVRSNDLKLLPNNKKLRRFVYNNKTLSSSMYLWCPLPWNHITILCDGTVTLCCKTNLHDNRCVMGNIFKENFKDIWNNLKYIRIRKKFLQNTKRPTNKLLKECRYCYLGGVTRLNI
jgi:MoaA/NifB/PqqE/SkfB family radical SAM enzyme